MPQPAQSSASMEPKTTEKIPPLISIDPSIFVPLQDDIAAFEPPRDRVQRLKRILETVDYQRQGVKENLLYMFEREKKRIIQQAAEEEQAQGQPNIKPGLAPNEVDDTIANMEAPAQPGGDYNVRHMPDFDTITPIAPNASLRDKTVRDLLLVVERAVQDLQGFEGYTAKIKDHYLKCLEQETSRIEDAGKRPEERSGARGF